MADIMEDLIVAEILSTCGAIDNNITVVKATEDDYDILAIPVAMCPMVLLRRFKTMPAREPGLGRREVVANVILAVVLKYKNCHKDIRKAQRDVEDAMMVDRHRGQNSVVNTKWISSEPYVFQSEHIAWSFVEFNIYWSEVRS